MSWLLPKGIVINSPEIEGSIERNNTEPLDLADIAKFWKVYTTTKRRLLDPTAERLENYWWRIWGSRRRELNGATVASLFATISNGDSFVPLRGPANRDEGSAPWKRAAAGGSSGASSTTALHRASRPSTTSSSVSKSATMPHPILKKSRGPSTTGPRPTARFISPHESEDDPGSPACENTHVVVQPPSPDRAQAKPEKKVTSGKKARGYVTAPAVKRPVIFRRKSSQSSTESPARSVETASSGLESSLEAPTPTYPEADTNRGKPQSKFLENFSPANRLPSPSRAKPATNVDAKRLSPRSPRKDRAGANLKTPESTLADRRRTSDGDLVSREHEAREAEEGKGRTDVRVPPRRSQSDMFQGTQRRDTREVNASRYLSSDTKSSASIAPTLAAATGQVAVGEEDSAARRPGLKAPDKGKRRASDESRPGKTVPPRPPNGEAEVSWTRSRSQLSLVLEKDRARRE